MRLLAFCLSVLGAQAQALSCLAVDAVWAFQQAEADPDPIYIVHGQVSFDAALLPQGVMNEERTPDPIAGTINGMGLTRSGFNAPFDRDVLVQSQCAGPWCGRLAADTTYLMFVRQTPDALVIEVNPCGGTVFQDPTVAVLDQMTRCIRGDACESAVN